MEKKEQQTDPQPGRLPEESTERFLLPPGAPSARTGAGFLRPFRRSKRLWVSCLSFSLTSTFELALGFREHSRAVVAEIDEGLSVLQESPLLTGKKQTRKAPATLSCNVNEVACYSAQMTWLCDTGIDAVASEGRNDGGSSSKSQASNEPKPDFRGDVRSHPRRLRVSSVCAKMLL